MALRPEAGAQAATDAAGRRTRLRQYQSQLLERVQAARNQTGVAVKHVGVQVGARRYLLDLTEAGEIVPLAQTTPVPLTQAWYLGLANIRGKLVGIIDLAVYLGEAPTAAGPDSRLITFGAGQGYNCALLAARVLGLRHPEQMEALDAGHWRDAEGQDWTRLDLLALVREPRFLHIGL